MRLVSRRCCALPYIIKRLCGACLFYFFLTVWNSYAVQQVVLTGDIKQMALFLHWDSFCEWALNVAGANIGSDFICSIKGVPQYDKTLLTYMLVPGQGLIKENLSSEECKGLCPVTAPNLWATEPEKWGQLYSKDTDSNVGAQAFTCRKKSMDFKKVDKKNPHT